MAKSEAFKVIPIKSPKMQGAFSLGKVILQCLEACGQELRDGDILVVSSKFAALAEGRYVALNRIVPTERAVELAKKYELDSLLAELIIQESEEILGGIPGFTLAMVKGTLAPNAGIDRSNIQEGHAILYPIDPVASARKLRTYLLSHSAAFKDRKSRLGIVLSDSRITPTRLGTIGIAISASGFKPVIDLRGRKDLFGNELKVTQRAIADQLACAAQLVMGEAAEATPIVLIRGYNAEFEDKSLASMTIPFEKCLYIQGLQNPPRGENKQESGGEL